MRQFLACLLSPMLLGVCAVAAGAQTVHVPAGYATIQAAVNSGATLVYVSDGTYPETVTINNNVTLLPEPPTNTKAQFPFPRVTGLSINRNASADIEVYVRGFHFTGLVSSTDGNPNSAIITIEGCKLDGGFQSYGSSGLADAIRIRSCVITGDVFVFSYNTDFTGNMVWKGTANVKSNGGTGGILRDNLVIGPSSNGLVSASTDAPAHVTGNMVKGVVTGYTMTGGNFTGNVAEDCSGSAFVMSTMNYVAGMTASGNTVHRGGNGFDLRVGSVTTVTGNTVDSTGAVGILATSPAYANATNNTVMHSGGDGIRISGVADGNVVGRGAARGIVAAGGSHNTVFLNAGAGFDLNGTGGTAVANNIGYGNGTYGLVWSGTGAPALACNDWFGNAAGATSGTVVGGTDLALNPLFCNLPLNDVHLSASSPVLSPGACGLVGALGSGCTAATSVTPGDGGDVRFAAFPNPSGGGVTLMWARSSAPSRVEVFDLLGRLRFQADLPAETDRLAWPGHDREGHALPAGVYYARRTTGAVREHTRIVLAR